MEACLSSRAKAGFRSRESVGEPLCSGSHTSPRGTGPRGQAPGQSQSCTWPPRQGAGQGCPPLAPCLPTVSLSPSSGLASARPSHASPRQLHGSPEPQNRHSRHHPRWRELLPQTPPEADSQGRFHQDSPQTEPTQGHTGASDMLGSQSPQAHLYRRHLSLRWNLSPHLRWDQEGSSPKYP